MGLRARGAQRLCNQRQDSEGADNLSGLSSSLPERYNYPLIPARRNKQKAGSVN